MNWHLFSAFLFITLILVLIPGPIVTLVIATGASRGYRAALQTVIGTTLGNAVLLACIALGLSWILKASAEVFDYIRWAGAAYLVWLGVQAWRHAGTPVQTRAVAGHVFARRGFLVAITNPKTIAFFTAFLPQFIDPTLPVTRQLVVMCTVSAVLAGFIDAGWATVASLGRAFLMKPKYNKLLGRFSGLVLIGGGVWLSLTRARA